MKSDFSFSAETVKQISNSNKEPDWLKEHRLFMFDEYQKKEFSSRKEEEWRRTDLRLFDTNKFYPIGFKDEYFHASKEPIDKSTYDASLEEINCSTIYNKLSEIAQKKGIIFCDLSDAVKKYPELVKKFYNEKIDATQLNKLEAMNGAFWNSGIFLFIPENIQLNLPIRYLSILNKEDLSAIKKNILVIGEGSKICFYEESFAPNKNENGLAVNNTTIYCEKDADVSYIYFQRLSNNHYVFSFDKAYLKEGSKLNWLPFDFGGKLSKIKRKVDIIGSESSCKMLGGFFVNGLQHTDIVTVLEHKAPRTNGDVLYKGVLTDMARSAFRGAIIVNKESKQTESFLHNYILVLSPDARADSVPTLEILASDVRCKHTASMSEIDENQLFYLMSRGLSEIDAKKIIIEGFFEEIISNTNSKLVETKVRKNIEEKFKYELFLGVNSFAEKSENIVS